MDASSSAMLFYSVSSSPIVLPPSCVSMSIWNPSTEAVTYYSINAPTRFGCRPPHRRGMALHLHPQARRRLGVLTCLLHDPLLLQRQQSVVAFCCNGLARHCPGHGMLSVLEFASLSSFSIMWFRVRRVTGYRASGGTGYGAA
jgi:hypothetical protein